MAFTDYYNIIYICKETSVLPFCCVCVYIYIGPICRPRLNCRVVDPLADYQEFTVYLSLHFRFCCKQFIYVLYAFHNYDIYAMSSCGVGQYFEKVSSKEKLGNNGAGETIFFSAKTYSTLTMKCCIVIFVWCSIFPHSAYCQWPLLRIHSIITRFVLFCHIK